MKNLVLLFLLIVCPIVETDAQITAFNNAAQNNFYGIGGYSFSQYTFPVGLQPTPYVVAGPSPQNDFSYAISTNGGAINNTAGYITTTDFNANISIGLKGNNVRKFACHVFAYETGVISPTNNIISLTATTNLGNTATQTGSNAGQFVGFNVIGNENEYIVSVVAQFQSTPSPAAKIALYSIMVGDNSPQNVALNFDGVNDYVEIPSNNGNNTGLYVNFTVTCWIKPDATQSTTSSPNPDENDILSKWAGLGSGTNNKYPFVVRYLNTTRSIVSERGKILVGIWDGTNFPLIISSTAVNDGKWHHVAFVKTPTTLSLYIDGVPNGTTSNTVGTNSTINNTPLQIGRRGNGQNYFRGDIDEVRIWSTNKSQATIQAEMFCKNPNTTALQAAYNFSNGVPHDNNDYITQVQDASTRLAHGTLNNFVKIGDVSNFVTGQVKYVSGAFTGANNGSSWANGFDLLQSALSSNSCNDLFEVYVAKGFQDYKPSITGNASQSFIIPTGMRIFGGFAGTEKSINQRNMALIHTTYKTTLSGDLFGNDSPFNFSSNRNDNSDIVVQVNGNDVIFDGFTVKNAKSTSGGLYISGSNTTIKNSRIVDNSVRGIVILGNNPLVTDCFVLGNNGSGIYVQDVNTNFNNNLIANNGTNGITYVIQNGDYQTNITNCTITANREFGISFSPSTGRTLTNLMKNTIMYDNGFGGIFNDGSGTISNTLTHSLVQGETNTANGNLNGNTTNPQFVSPLANTVRSDAGDYRLKDSSPCINTGTDAGVSPLDLDRNLRPKGGKTDMGAYESNVNMDEIISIATGNWESNTTWNLNRQPLNTDKVIINSGHDVTVTTNAAVAKNVEYKANAKVILQVLGALRVGL